MVISHCSYNYRISKIRAYVIKSNIRQYSLRNCPGFSHNLDSVKERKQNPSEQGSTEHRAQASCYKYIRSRSKYFSRLFLLSQSVVFGLFCSVRSLWRAGVKIMNALVTETNLVIECGDWSALRPGPQDQKYLSLGHWVMNHWKFLFEHVN